MLENREKTIPANVMKKDELNERVPKKVQPIESDNNWTLKLFGCINISRQSKMSSKTQVCNSLLSFDKNVI